MTDRTLIRIQASSGAIFLVFTLVHLANTASGAAGPETYDAFQRGARAVYQIPWVEIVAIALPLAVHFTAALERLRRDGFRRRDRSLRGRLHRATGRVLLVVIGGHILAVRGPSLFLDFHPDAGGLAFSLWWMPWVFYPYYTLFAFSAAYHGWNGLFLFASSWGRPLAAALRTGPGFWLPVGLVCALTLAGVLRLGGAFGDIADPTDNAYARMWEDFGYVDLAPGSEE